MFGCVRERGKEKIDRDKQTNRQRQIENEKLSEKERKRETDCA